MRPVMIFMVLLVFSFAMGGALSLFLLPAAPEGGHDFSSVAKPVPALPQEAFATGLVTLEIVPPASLNETAP